MMVKLRFPFRDGRRFARSIERFKSERKKQSIVGNIAKKEQEKIILQEKVLRSVELQKEKERLKTELEKEKLRLKSDKEKRKLQEKFKPKSKKKGNLGKSLEKFFTVE